MRFIWKYGKFDCIFTETYTMSIQVTKYVDLRPSDRIILQMVADDVPKVNIAKKLKISVRTVEASMFKIKNEFGCRKESALIAELMRRNIIK